MKVRYFILLGQILNDKLLDHLVDGSTLILYVDEEEESGVEREEMVVHSLDDGILSMTILHTNDIEESKIKMGNIIPMNEPIPELNYNERDIYSVNEALEDIDDKDKKKNTIELADADTRDVM